MQQTAPLLFEATISSLAPGGSGVAHLELSGERRAVFVANVAAGDRVRLEVDLGSRPARGTLLEVVVPGPDRVTPACPWSVACGGCDWMHLSLAAQARTHSDHLRSFLPAAWRDFAIEMHPASEALAYRVRARVHVRCGRSRRVLVGMHAAGTREPVEVATCAVLHPALDRARGALGELFEGCPGQGEVQLGRGNDGRAVCEVRWTGTLLPEFFGRLERAVVDGSFAGFRVVTDEARRPADVGDPAAWMTGGDERPLRLGVGGFGQANEAMNATLARYVAASIREPRSKKAVELYAGAGNLSILVAPEVGDLVCVEASREGCDAARANLEARGLRGRVTDADAEAFEWKSSTDLLILDPPRTGARAVAERLARSRVGRVVYVSCDAPTLGRDLALLERTYALRSLATFEMFPQTSHVEIVAILDRRRPGSAT